MKTCPARWTALACAVLALVVVYSCSDDDTTCPTPVCSFPAKAFYGTWTTFAATFGGSPTSVYDSMQFHFSDSDTMLVTAPQLSDTMLYLWSANDSSLFLELTPSQEEILVFGYKITADTLDLWDRMATIDLTLRMLKSH